MSDRTAKFLGEMFYLEAILTSSEMKFITQFEETGSFFFFFNNDIILLK